MGIMMQGLSLSITGLVITFLALGIFIFIMFFLQWIFPPKPKAVESSGEYSSPTGGNVDDEEAVVAAIFAVNYLRSRSKSRLGERLESRRG